jgi:DNA-binding NarL/FixJ family response regulator
VSAVRVVIADDHPLFRQGLAALLRDAPETELVGQAADGDHAVALVREKRPDVVVLDVSMPGCDGVEIARRVLEAQPSAAVLMLTMMDDDAVVSAALRVGAAGYLLKGSVPDQILRAVLAVASGQAILEGEIARRLERILGDPASALPDDVFPELTPRERQVLALVAEGEGNDEVARRLGIGGKTVRNNVSSILTKLGVPTRAAAVALARDAGLGTRKL